MVGRTHIASMTAVFTAFMIFQVYAFLIYDPILLAVGAALMALVVLHGHHHILQRELTASRLILITIVAALTLALPFALNQTLVSSYHYTIGVTSILAAYIFSRFPLETYQGLRLALVALQSYTIWFLLTTTHTVFPLDYMIEGSSSNGITSVLVILQAAYVGISFHVRRKAAIITSLATLYIALEGFGRGSILSAAMICFLMLPLYFLSIRTAAGRLAVILVALIVLAFFVPRTIDVVSNYLVNSTKLSQGLLDPARAEMYRDYLAKIDPVTFFTGTDFEGTSIEAKYNGNPHSSLIRAHHLFGILYLLAVLGSLAGAVLATRSWVSLFITGALISIILFRSVSEPVIFPTAMDFFVFVFLFIACGSPRSRASRAVREAPRAGIAVS